MINPVALICNRIQDGYDYFDLKEIKQINRSTCQILLNNGITYQIITSLDQAKGLQFSAVVISPRYQDELIATVRNRVRNNV